MWRWVPPFSQVKCVSVYWPGDTHGNRVCFSRHCSTSPQPFLPSAAVNSTSPGPWTVRKPWLSNLSATSCGVTGINHSSFRTLWGALSSEEHSSRFTLCLKLCTSSPHPAYADSFHRTSRLSHLQMRRSISIPFKNTLCLPLGTCAMLSPNPLSTLCANGSCEWFLSKHPLVVGASNLPFLTDTQSMSDCLGSVRVAGTLPGHHHPREGRKKALSPETLCQALTQWLPSSSGVLLRQTWGWNKGRGNRTWLSAMGSYCQCQSIRKILTHHPHCYCKPQTHSPTGLLKSPLIILALVHWLHSLNYCILSIYWMQPPVK